MDKGKSQYNTIIETLPATEYRKEILLRVAGDDSVMVEYGEETVLDYMDVFNTITLSEEMEKRNANKYRSLAGFIQILRGLRTVVVNFDPRIISMNQMVDVIKDCLIVVADDRYIARQSFNSAIIEMPLCWEDSNVIEANKRYLRERKPDGSIDVDPVTFSSVPYVAKYNGISTTQLKEKIFTGEWISVAASGFLIGLQTFLPVDRRYTIRSSKRNPPMGWSKRGSVGLGGSSLAWGPMDSGTGFHHIGRTSPSVQLSQKHPSFKQDVSLFHPFDRLRFYEVSETELMRIEKLIDEGSSEFVYKMTPGRFSVAEWIELEKECKDDIEAWLRHIDEAASIAPIP